MMSTSPGATSSAKYTVWFPGHDHPAAFVAVEALLTDRSTIVLVYWTGSEWRSYMTHQRIAVREWQPVELTT